MAKSKALPSGHRPLLRAAAKLAKDVFRYITFRPTQFRGVYGTFHQAEADAPRTKRIGYNHSDLAREYQEKLTLRLDSSDYPALYHLSHIISDHCTILEFGGNIGDRYLRYRKHLDLERVRWIICDLPEITAIGQEVCAHTSNVEFINDIAEVRESRVRLFLAVGSIQYVESPDILLAKLLNKGIRPNHILTDQVPLYSGRRFVTLQNGGLVCYPQHVFNREQYIDAIANLDYVLVDSWGCGDSSVIPFHPDKTHSYSGLYFSDKRGRGTQG
jgi:putative methyltransferase (TIGR04325 family)